MKSRTYFFIQAMEIKNLPLNGIRHHAEKRQGGRVSKRENDYMNDVNEKMQGYLTCLIQKIPLCGSACLPDS